MAPKARSSISRSASIAKTYSSSKASRSISLKDLKRTTSATSTTSSKESRAPSRSASQTIVLTDAERAALEQQELTKKRIDDRREDLVPHDVKYAKLWKQMKEANNYPKCRPIHIDDETAVEKILRCFDLDPEYGPCLGMTRKERWDRAQSMGDHPPPEILEILETKQGATELARNVLVGHGI